MNEGCELITFSGDIAIPAVGIELTRHASAQSA